MKSYSWEKKNGKWIGDINEQGAGHENRIPHSLSSADAKEQPSWGWDKTSFWDPGFWVAAPYGKGQAYLAPGTSVAVATKQHSLYHQVSQFTLYLVSYALSHPSTESQDKPWYHCIIGMGIYCSTFMGQNSLDSNCKWDPSILDRCSWKSSTTGSALILVP